jgi:hypothetical protein
MVPSNLDPAFRIRENIKSYTYCPLLNIATIEEFSIFLSHSTISTLQLQHQPTMSLFALPTELDPDLGICTRPVRSKVLQ